MYEVMQIVAKNIGGDWKWLARQLKVAEGEIEAIDNDFKSTEEKAFQALIKWYRAHGKSAATKHALIKALKSIHHTTIAEELENEGAICQVTECEKKPFQEDKETSSPEAESLPTPHTETIHTYNEKLNESLSGILKACQDILANASRPVLVYNEQILAHVGEINKLLLESMNKESKSGEDKASTQQHKNLKELKKECRTRDLQIDQTRRFTVVVLSHARKSKGKRTRPQSEIPTRCTSFGDLRVLRRVQTYSSGVFRYMDISSPMLTSQASVLERHSSIADIPVDTNSDLTSLELYNVSDRPRIFGEFCCRRCPFNAQRQECPLTPTSEDQEPPDENSSQITEPEVFAQEMNKVVEDDRVENCRL